MAVDSLARAVSLAAPTKEDLANQKEELKQYVDEKTTAAIAGDGVTNIVQLTQAQYDALSVKDNKTLYIILG
jgi:hypothetical protein